MAPADFFRRNSTEPRIKLVTIPFTTAVVNVDFLKQHGGIPVKVTIDNQDTTNSIAYRISKQRTNNDLTAAPNGETIIENLLIEAFISLTPDAATGSGILSADLAWPADLVQMGWIPRGVVG